jgi:hypothetical protein
VCYLPENLSNLSSRLIEEPSLLLCHHVPLAHLLRRSAVLAELMTAIYLTPTIRSISAPLICETPDSGPISLSCGSRDVLRNLYLFDIHHVEEAELRRQTKLNHLELPQSEQ